MAYLAQIIITSWRAEVRAERRWGLVAAIQEILKRSVEGKAIEGLQFFDRDRRRQATGDKPALGRRGEMTTRPFAPWVAARRALRSGCPDMVRYVAGAQLRGKRPFLRA